MSIRGMAFQQTTHQGPASSASGGRHFSKLPNKGQHHEHQGDGNSASHPPRASIISIRGMAFQPTTHQKPASSASRGRRFSKPPTKGQHHQHQGGCVSANHPPKPSIMGVGTSANHPPRASIMSIRGMAFQQTTHQGPASSASGGWGFNKSPTKGQHREHRGGGVSANHPPRASIMSIRGVT